MAIYAVSNISERDEEAYERFWARFQKLIARFGGEIVAVDRNPDVIEGEWSNGVVLIVMFPSADAITAWQKSLEYRKIATDRNNAGSFSTILTHEYKPPSLDEELGTGARGVGFFLRVAEIMQVSVFACFSLLIVLIAVSLMRSEGLTFLEAISRFDWQLAIFLTSIWMVVAQAIDRRKYQYV